MAPLQQQASPDVPHHNVEPWGLDASGCGQARTEEGRGDSRNDVDRHGYSFRLWSFKQPEPVSVGDDVFVSLRSDKDTGRAKVVQDMIMDTGHQYRGRIKV